MSNRLVPFWGDLSADGQHIGQGPAASHWQPVLRSHEAQTWGDARHLSFALTTHGGAIYSHAVVPAWSPAWACTGRSANSPALDECSRRHARARVPLASRRYEPLRRNRIPTALQ
jgi:hypothetical protein